jgi:hypothetical protein
MKGKELGIFPANIRHFVNSRAPSSNNFTIFEKGTNADLFIECFPPLSEGEWDEFSAICHRRIRLWDRVIKAFGLPFEVAARWELKPEMSRL